MKEESFIPLSKDASTDLDTMVKIKENEIYKKNYCNFLNLPVNSPFFFIGPNQLNKHNDFDEMPSNDYENEFQGNSAIFLNLNETKNEDECLTNEIDRNISFQPKQEKKDSKIDEEKKILESNKKEIIIIEEKDEAKEEGNENIDTQINLEKERNIRNNNNPFKVNLGRKRGRDPKNSSRLARHSGLSADNIKTSIKVKIHQVVLNLLNSKFSNTRSKKKLLQKIVKKETNKKSIEYFKKWLNTPASQIFSIEISEKCKNFEKAHNKNIIQNILDENKETELILFLNKKMGEYFEVFVKNEEKKDFEKMEKLDKVKENFKIKKISQEKIDKYVKICKDIEKYWEEIKNKE